MWLPTNNLLLYSALHDDPVNNNIINFFHDVLFIFINEQNLVILFHYKDSLNITSSSWLHEQVLFVVSLLLLESISHYEVFMITFAS